MTAKKTTKKAKVASVVSKKVTKKDVEVAVEKVAAEMLPEVVEPVKLEVVIEEAEKVGEKVVEGLVESLNKTDIVIAAEVIKESSLINTKFMHGTETARVTSQDDRGICTALKEGKRRKGKKVTLDFEIRVTAPYVNLHKIN